MVVMACGLGAQIDFGMERWVRPQWVRRSSECCRVARVVVSFFSESAVRGVGCAVVRGVDMIRPWCGVVCAWRGCAAMVACHVRCGDGCNRYAERFAAEAGVAVLLFDYRGFGSSEVLGAKNIGALSFFQRLNCTCCVCLSLSLSVSVCVLGGGACERVCVRAFKSTRFVKVRCFVLCGCLQGAVRDLVDMDMHLNDYRLSGS